MVIERQVDFHRARYMRCGRCGHEWPVDDAWLDRFTQAEERCPRCGIDCQEDDRPRFWARPGDPSTDDSVVRGTHWYHTSTHTRWPNKDFNPAAELTEDTRQRMRAIGPDGRGLERWIHRQRTKALHLGTYEAAIENMLRRMRLQSNAGDQFQLYRVRLDPDVAIEPGVHKERNRWGDVHLAEVCGADANVLRYVNEHEDPSSVSLAVSIDAISAVQQVPMPLPVHSSEPWVASATARLLEAAAKPDRPLVSKLDRIRGSVPSALSEASREIELDAANQLPLRLRDRLRARSDRADFADDPSIYPRKLAGIVQLVCDPAAVMHALDVQPWREL